MSKIIQTRILASRKQTFQPLRWGNWREFSKWADISGLYPYFFLRPSQIHYLTDVHVLRLTHSYTYILVSVMSYIHLMLAILQCTMGKTLNIIVATKSVHVGWNTAWKYFGNWSDNILINYSTTSDSDCSIYCYEIKLCLRVWSMITIIGEMKKFDSSFASVRLRGCRHH